MELVVGLRVYAGRLGLESGCGGHGVFTSDTDTVEELGPADISIAPRPETSHSRVADDPAVERSAPRGSQHDKTKRHDQGVLNETESTSDPVSLETDKNLTDNDTDDLKVVDGGNPVVVADQVRGGPALRPDGSVQAGQVTDGEQPGISKDDPLS